MGRKVLSLSLPQSLYNKYEKLAKRNGKTKSELFREIIRLYEQEKREEEFYKLQRRVSKAVRKKGIYTEKDIEKIVLEGR